METLKTEGLRGEMDVDEGILDPSVILLRS